VRFITIWIAMIALLGLLIPGTSIQYQTDLTDFQEKNIERRTPLEY
jgi:hypothetical protein